MGRPEPCVLFAQSFVHSQLDEYVDEVLFAEPIIITACEFLEQNASPSNPMVSLVGATSPPSFALEVFVQCEGESRFRRLCHPFLYSHSSSNVLEVEAVVTNHLVVRGSYRSLTLVVYGNIAEDLGQFNIDVDLDSSLANLVCSPSEGKLEDLPPALHSIKLPFEESVSSLKSLSLPVLDLDLSVEMKEFLQLTFKICQISGHDDTVCKVVRTVVSAVSSYVSSDHHGTTITLDRHKLGNLIDSKIDPQQVINVLAEARIELLELYYSHQSALGNESTKLLDDEILLEPKPELAATSEVLVYLFNQCFPFNDKTPVVGHFLLSQTKNTILTFGLVLLLCSARESCFHFVNSGVMEQIAHIFCHEIQRSTATTIMLLCAVEHATRHAIGCEGFLGWWPREDENVPVGNSDVYCHLLSLLMQKQRHDVASLATYILHRLRSYEIAARYESAVLSVLTNLSADCWITTDRINSLATANSQLKFFLKLLNLHGPIEDPSPMAFVKSSILDQAEGLLSYRATIDFIALSKYSFSTWDIDTHLLSLFKERGFLPLSAALLSSPTLSSANGSTMEVFMDIAASIELILLSLLCCRSGLAFLLLQPEATATLILSLRGVEDTDTAECMTLRHAAVLISKGFFCRPQEIGMIAELHLRVGNTVDRLLTAAPHSEEQLWLLWELCSISRSDCGRQALLAVGQFSEVVSVLTETLRSFKDLDPVGLNNNMLIGSSPLSLAIFHSAAEIFEVMITDSTASSLASWIEHAVDLHKALHSSFLRSNKKDAPTRVLEWIDAGVVYHRNGAIGLLRYGAVLASGGDAHLSSASVLVSDSMDVENVVGDSSGGSDSLVVDNLLGKLVSDKYFDGVTLHKTSIVQLTTTFRILAFISENSAVAASLYEEGAVTLVYVVLVNCKFMLEQSSNTFDYLVDEGAECNTTSDLLLERSHEHSLVELMIPSLVLLINLLQKLKEANEQYRNTKLLNALLKLHRELSPKLAACATDLSFPYPGSALGLGAVCHLLVSALASWPVFGWTPGLFHCLLESVHASSSLALGPKDACSLLCLLGDLFPEEGIWLWKNGMPSLSALRALSVGTILGPEAERYADWYLQPEHLKVLLGRLTPQLDKIAQIILHFAFTDLVVLQDIFRVFIIRIACQRAECAVVLLGPIISWLNHHINETVNLSETDFFKVYRLLEFVAGLLEHPCTTALLLKMGAVEILAKVLERSYDASESDEKLISESRIAVKSAINVLSWSLPVFKSLALVFDPEAPTHQSRLCDECSIANLSIKDCFMIGRHLLKLCQVLAVGRELLACLIAFKELASCSQGRSVLASIFLKIPSSSLEVPEQAERENEGNLPDEFDWRSSPPLLNCWKRLLSSLNAKETFSIEAVHALSFGGLCLCKEGKNLEGVAILKCLFGLPYDVDSAVSEEMLKDVHELIALLDQRISEEEYLASSTKKTSLSQVKESVKSMLLVLQRPAGSSAKVEGLVSSEGSASSEDVVSSMSIPPLLLMPSISMTSMFAEPTASSHFWNSHVDPEKASYSISFGGLAEKFVWECPDSAPDRLMMASLPLKKKLSSAEGSNRRGRDNTGPESMVSYVFSRGMGASGPTRRDTFRQRKPNTSRPPSMHVDDYVARERNIDGLGTGTNVVSTSQRGGSTSGRPPSIHVDEFMARQRERQNPMAVTVGDTVQARNLPLEHGDDPEKSDRSRKLKAELDDDLHEINIVFDEETESDGRLPFPQPDDNLHPGPVIIGESSPGSVVEENEAAINENSRFPRVGTPPTFENGDSRSEFLLRRPISRPKTSAAQETHASSEKNYPGPNTEKTLFQEQSAESKYVAPTSKGFDTPPPTNLNAIPLHFYNAGSAPPSLQPSADSRLPPASFYHRDSPQKAANVSFLAESKGYYDQKPPSNQPPLPPMPPPNVSSMPSQTAELVQSHPSPYVHSVRDVQPPLPSGYPLQAFDVSGPSTIPSFDVSSASSSSMSSTTAQTVVGSKYSWVPVSSGSRLHAETYTSSTSARPLPPLPPTPPPFSNPPMTQSLATNSGSQSSLYNQSMQLSLPSTPLSDSRFGLFSTAGNSLTSYSLPPFASWTAAPVPGTLFSTLTQPPGQNPPNLSHPIPNPPPSIQSVQPHPPPPPPPPQAPRPHPQHPRPPVQTSPPQSEQVVGLQQSPIQVQPLQVQQQLQIPQIHVYYQPQQQENISQAPQPLLEQATLLNLQIQVDNASQHPDSGMTLQQYFSSPEAIQSLLSDRDKLCQLLEQHPKLMQMLQERLGQI